MFIFILFACRVLDLILLKVTSSLEMSLAAIVVNSPIFVGLKWPLSPVLLAVVQAVVLGRQLFFTLEMLLVC